MAPERSCLPSLCAPPAALFALPGVPPPEAPARHQREGGGREGRVGTGQTCRAESPPDSRC